MGTGLLRRFVAVPVGISSREFHAALSMRGLGMENTPGMSPLGGRAAGKGRRDPQGRDLPQTGPRKNPAEDLRQSALKCK